MRSFLAVILSSAFVKTMRGLFIFFLAIVAILSVMPDPVDMPVEGDVFAWLAAVLFGDPEQSDKITHFIAYGVLAGTATLGLIRPFGRYVVLPVMIVVFSGLMELAQGFISSRVPDMMDMVANMAGVASGSVVALAVLALAGHKFPSTKAAA